MFIVCGVNSYLRNRLERRVLSTSRIVAFKHIMKGTGRILLIVSSDAVPSCFSRRSLCVSLSERIKIKSRALMSVIFLTIVRLAEFSTTPLCWSHVSPLHSVPQLLASASNNSNGIVSCGTQIPPVLRYLVHFFCQWLEKATILLLLSETSRSLHLQHYLWVTN